MATNEGQSVNPAPCWASLDPLDLFNISGPILGADRLDALVRLLDRAIDKEDSELHAASAFGLIQ